jgi:uncharacterized protein YigA (DUF484 family)
MKTIIEIQEELNCNCEDLVCEAKRKYLYVCKNNGAFHCGDAEGLGGFATFIGKFDTEQANMLYDRERKYIESYSEWKQL